MNDMLYRFGAEEVVEQKLDLIEKTDLFQQCKQEGLSNMQASTISTIMRQVQMNLPELTVEGTAAEQAQQAEEEEKPKKRGRKPKVASNASYNVNAVPT